MNVVNFRGRALDGDALSTFLHELTASGDVGAPFDVVDVLASLTPANYARARQEMRAAYKGKQFDLRTLDRAVRAVRSAPPRVGKIRRLDAAPEELGELGATPEICVNGDTPSAITDAVIAQLLAHNNVAAVYQQDRTLTRLRCKPDGQTETDPLDADKLRATVEETIRCYTLTGGSETSEAKRHDVLLPMDLTRLILARRSWPFPPLEGISRVPVVRPDGTIWDTPGYDAPSRVVYAPDADVTIPAIAETPTQDDARAAAARLLDYFVDFPFVNAPTDTANALACAMTPMLRAVIAGPVPLALLDATHPSSGKSLLARILVEMGTARRREQVDVQTWPNGDESEARKLITTIAKQGDDIVLLDNLSGVFHSSTLCAALTTPGWSDRLLSRNERVTFPLRCTWLATGNGVRLGSDLYRRCYWIRLDPQDAHPEMRDPSEFKHEHLEEEIQANRGAILADMLTMIRAWYVAGKPRAVGSPVMGSYETWSQLLAGILHYAGVSGFLATQRADQAQADEDSQQWEVFLLAWHEHYGEEAQRIQDAARFMLDDPLSAMSDNLPPFLDREYGKAGNGFRVALGSALRARHRRRFGDSGVYAEQCDYDGHAKAWRWRVSVPTQTGPDLDPSASSPADADADADAETHANSRQDAAHHELADEIAETVTSSAKSTPAPARTPTAGKTWYSRERWYDPSRPDGALSQALQWACCGNVAAAHAWMRSAKLRQRWEAGSTIIAGATGTQGTSPAAFVSMLRGYYEHANTAMITHTAAYLGADPRGVLASSPAPEPVNTPPATPTDTAVPRVENNARPARCLTCGEHIAASEGQRVDGPDGTIRGYRHPTCPDPEPTASAKSAAAKEHEA